MKKITAVILTGAISTFSLAGHADETVNKNLKKHYKNHYKEAKKHDYKNTTPVTPPASPLTGTFALTTNYMFRGISNTNNLPAVQGGLTYTFLSGIYFNIWGSNVNFLDSQGSTATVELDTIAGIRNSIGDNFSYDINIDRYNYPKTVASYNEFIANIAWYFLTAQIGFSSNVYNYHGNGTYYNLGARFDIPPKYILNFNDVVLSGGIGHYSLPRNAGLSSYNDYNLMLSKTIGSYVLAVQWTDTNGRSVDDPALRDSHIIGTVTVNF